MMWHGSRCVVLGAGGFLGINLCLALHRAGARVTGVGRPPQVNRNVVAGVGWRETEFDDEIEVARAVQGQDVVFHLLGGSVPADSNNDPVGDVQASLVPTLRLIEACRNARVGRFVFSSSGGTVYGLGPSVPVAETSPTNPITAYGVNKLAIEKYLGLYHHLHGLRSVSLRIANPYGPYQHRRRPQGLVGTALARAIAGEQIEVWGDGSITRDYIYVDDVVEAMLSAALYSGPYRVFNVGSGVGRTVRGVVQDICGITSTLRDRVTFHPSRPADVPYNVLDISLLRTETGWTPRTSWEEGLRLTASWLSAEFGGPPAIRTGWTLGER